MSTSYELIDFGDGRKLERFGEVVIDRPCPVADQRRHDARRWTRTWQRFDGNWQQLKRPPSTWEVQFGSTKFALRATPAGQVGVFAEQAGNWEWIEQRLKGAPTSVLNLFAYTGGSTIAAAKAGAQVVHLDAAQNVVNWARENATLNGLTDAPIRWLCDDVQKFVQREQRRENRYHAIVLDPPSYGHGPKKQPWVIEDHLPALLQDCVKLLNEEWRFILLSCHTEQFPLKRLESLLRESLRSTGDVDFDHHRMNLKSSTGHQLSQGVSIRAVRNAT